MLRRASASDIEQAGIGSSILDPNADAGYNLTPSSPKTGVFHKDFPWPSIGRPAA